MSTAKFNITTYRAHQHKVKLPTQRAQKTTDKWKAGINQPVH